MNATQTQNKSLHDPETAAAL